MFVLGIETSCDETAASVVKNGKQVISNVVTSSLSLHKKYGGVVPEIAFRMQLEAISEVVNSCLKEARLELKDMELLCVTTGPGLLGSLLVGISFAKAISSSLDIPILGVSHLCSHIYASFLNGEVINLPFVGLVVSGGHTNIFYVKDFDKMKLLGNTLDDACGEAFDKVAKILGLGYPGGPIIEKLAKNGNAKSIEFRCSDTKNPMDFSFSGIKTAVLYYARKQSFLQNRQFTQSTNFRVSNLDHKISSDIACSFQETVIDSLIKKSFLACKFKNLNRLVIGGGVTVNNRLRERFYEEGQRKKIKIYFPRKEFCLDNAAMVAGLGYQLFKKGHRSDLNLGVDFS